MYDDNGDLCTTTSSKKWGWMGVVHYLLEWLCHVIILAGSMFNHFFRDRRTSASSWGVTGSIFLLTDRRSNGTMICSTWSPKIACHGYNSAHLPCVRTRELYQTSTWPEPPILFLFFASHSAPRHLTPFVSPCSKETSRLSISSKWQE